MIEGIEPYVCANSTCFSPDGNTMYFCDTWTQIINQFPYDQATGKVGAPVQFHSFKGYEAKTMPDGSCINSQGQMWNSHFTGKSIELYEKGEDGLAKVVKRIDMPTPN